MNIKEKTDSVDFTNEIQKHFERLSSVSSLSKVHDEEIELETKYFKRNRNKKLKRNYEFSL